MGLRDEILEQPAALAALLRTGRASIARTAEAIHRREVRYVVIAARGTSDHAAVYAQYLFGVAHRLPVALAAPSIRSLYGVEPRFDGALVIGISQSGASPDVVGIVAAARRQGVPTIAFTNEPASPLARAAEHVVDLSAGRERAVAATKTYTAELLALAIFSAAYGGRPTDPTLDAVPDAVAAALESEAAAAAAATEFAAMSACAVIGRGYDYATAREWALKLKELAGVVADPYSAADFRHGPVALVGSGFPVLVVAPSGPAAGDVTALLEALVGERGANALVLSDSAEVRRLGRRSIPLPAGLPSHLVPVASIVPGQLFAMHLAVARGLDPDAPRHLTKVTRTR